MDLKFIFIKKFLESFVEQEIKLDGFYVSYFGKCCVSLLVILKLVKVMDLDNFW